MRANCNHAPGRRQPAEVVGRGVIYLQMFYCEVCQLSEQKRTNVQICTECGKRIQQLQAREARHRRLLAEHPDFFLWCEVCDRIYAYTFRIGEVAEAASS